MHSTAMVRDRLSLGRAIPTGAIVSDADWREFERQEIAPRFPAGYSINHCEGAWQDQASGRLIHEPTTVFDVVRNDTADDSQKVLDIACAYKARFAQDAVLRSVEPCRVSFI